MHRRRNKINVGFEPVLQHNPASGSGVVLCQMTTMREGTVIILL